MTKMHVSRRVLSCASTCAIFLALLWNVEGHVEDSTLDGVSARNVAFGPPNDVRPGFSLQAPSSLFGSARQFSSPGAVGQHPRVLFNNDEWNAIVDSYASNPDEPWQKFFRTISQSHGLNNEALDILFNLDIDGATAEERAAYFNFWGLDSRGRDTYMSEYVASGLFLLTFEAFILEASSDSRAGDAFAKALGVLDRYSKILNAHADKYDCYKLDVPCVGKSDNIEMNSFLWDPSWELQHEWRSGVWGMALSYDVLYTRMDPALRTQVSSTIARVVAGRKSWGMDIDNKRLVSNWVPYHSHLYTANLAIEGEGHDETIHSRYPEMLQQYVLRAIYPDGGALEDGYVPSIGFREGSDALVAAARRGNNLLDTQKFRNFIYHTSLMYEPWFCGNYIGGSSGDGGGQIYPAFTALVRYVYPDGSLPAMMWRQKMGDDFKGEGVCRAVWTQVALQQFYLGGNHPESAARDISGLNDDIPSYHFSPYRGLVIARSENTPSALYTHFDARGECFNLGHDNADRGTFTVTALEESWVVERPWRQHYTSKNHALMHIDGLAQTLKAPCPKMVYVAHDEANKVILAAADLTDSYKSEWVKAWPIGGRDYSGQGYAPETASPETFGYFKDAAYDAEIGLPDSLHGDADFGFAGLWTWTKDYIPEISYAVRSTVHVQEQGTNKDAYFLVVDKIAKSGTGPFTFQFNIPLGDNVVIDEAASTSSRILLYTSTEDRPNGERTEKELSIVSFSASGGVMSYKTETVDGKLNLVLESVANEEEMWVIFHPHVSGSDSQVDASIDFASRVVTISVGGEEKYFKLNEEMYVQQVVQPQLCITTVPPTVSTTTSPVLAPQEPFHLAVYTTGRYSSSDFNTDTARFPMPNLASDPQIVISFDESTEGTGKLYTILHACHRKNEGVMRMTLIRCNNYETRDCEAVPIVISDNACHGMRPKVREALAPGKYYAILENAQPEPKAYVRHSLA